VIAAATMRSHHLLKYQVFLASHPFIADVFLGCFIDVEFHGLRAFFQSPCHAEGAQKLQS
jgi:hypothetical protein